MLSLWYDLGRPGHQAKDHIEKQKTGSHADFLSALAIAVIQLLIVISNWASFNHIYDTNLDKDDATELEVLTSWQCVFLAYMIEGGMSSNEDFFLHSPDFIKYF